MWTLGLDLDGHAAGALRFAAAIEAPWSVVHVLDLSGVGAALPAEALDEASRAESLVVSSLARAAGVEGRVAVLCETCPVEVALEHEVLAAGAKALVVGRRAPAESHALVRLGSIARRLLRRLPAPVIIVPPDFVALAPGPVLVASDLRTDSDQAVVFARELASLLSRELRVICVFEPVARARVAVVAEALAQAGLEDTEDARSRSVHAWCERVGVPREAVDLARGDALHEVLRAGREREAAVLVCGSRRLGTLDRLFTASFGSSLAAVATVPVAVVPTVAAAVATTGPEDR